MKKIIAITLTGLALVSGALAQTTSFTITTDPDGSWATQSEGHYDFGGGFISDYSNTDSSTGSYGNSYQQRFPNGSILSGTSGSTYAGEYHSTTDNVYNFGGGYTSELSYSSSSAGGYENSYKHAFPSGTVLSSFSGTTSDGLLYDLTDNTYAFREHSIEVINGTTANGQTIDKVINR